MAHLGPSTDDIPQVVELAQTDTYSDTAPMTATDSQPCTKN